ncbi:MAG: hypothetical protein M1840_001798 [Geoglossum simile]|nr:MAG: hypothetical protein M1840_001798 [Geoglossum simile]
MADPVSIGTGVVGVIGVALQLTVFIKDLTSRWKSCPDEVSSLLRELTALEDVLENLQVFLMSNNSDHFEQTSALYSAAGECVLKLEAFRHKLQRYEPVEGNKIRKVLERVRWPMDEKDNQKMLLELQRYTQLFNFAMSIGGCKLLSQTSSNVSEALDLLQALSTDGARLSQQLTPLIQTVASLPDNSREVAKISRSVQKLESKWNNQKAKRQVAALASHGVVKYTWLMCFKEKIRRRLLERLLCIDNEKKHIALRRIRHHGTGLWIADSEPFKSWNEEPGSSFSLRRNNAAGSGKTVLASNIVDIITASITSNPGFAIAYYYCDYSVANSLELPTILRAIIKQLLERLLDIPEDVGERLQQCCLEDSELLTNNLFSVIGLFSKVFLVIDGVDELVKEEQVTTLSVLKRLAKAEVTTVKLFVLGRRGEVYIAKQLNSFPRMDLSTENITADIASFVKEAVKSKIKSKEIIIRNPALEHDIVKALVNGADGMFLWVTLQMAELYEAATDDAIRKVLRTLPRGLAATYERILDKIIVSTGGAEKATLAIKTFKWIICARRPLRIDELKEAVGIESTHKFWDPDKIPTDDDQLIRCWGNLVVFDTNDKTVRLAHYTVQQFLLSESAGSEHFCFRQSEAEIEVGEICVAYLSFSDFEIQATKLKPKVTLLDIEVVETSIWSQLSLPRVAIWVLSFFRRRTDLGRQPPQIDILNLLQDLQPRKPPLKILEERYQLLDYAIHNWVFHSTRFSEETSAWQRFRNLAMKSEMQFDHRPWGENHVPPDLPYLALFRWAVDKGHAPLLRLLQHPSAGLDLSKYYRLASRGDQSQLLRNMCQRGHESVLSLFLEAGVIKGRSLADSRLVIDAVESESDKVLELLLKHGSNASAKDGGGCPALCIAVKNSHESTAKLLLDYEADVKAKDFNGDTALHGAAEGGHESVVRLLIEKGADVNEKDDRRWTALRGAAKGGYESVVRLLIEKGADINAMAGGRTALHEAAEGGHGAVMRLLIEKGAEISVGDGGRAVLHGAAKGGNESVVRLLIEKGISVGAKDHRGLTALYRAAKGGHESVVRLLIEKGAEINAKGGGRTVLHGAAKGGNESVVRLLIEKGVSVGAKDHRGLTALYRAAKGGHEPVVQLLIEKEADINAKGGGRTVLHGAAEGGNESVVRLLIEKGISVGAKDHRGLTALHEAAKGGHGAVVRLLIEKGADVNEKDDRRWTALRGAAKGGYESVVRLLIEKGAEINAEGGGRTALHEAANGGHGAVVRLLIEKGADVEAKDNWNSTALHLAASDGYESVVRLLMEKGADVNAKDSSRGTVLHSAVWGGNRSVVRLLIEKGADIETKDDRGRTALHGAAERGNEPVVRLLIENGADIETRDGSWRTALHMATESGHKPVARLLIENGADTETGDSGWASHQLAMERRSWI